MKPCNVVKAGQKISNSVCTTEKALNKIFIRMYQSPPPLHFPKICINLLTCGAPGSENLGHFVVIGQFFLGHVVLQKLIFF